MLTSGFSKNDRLVFGMVLPRKPGVKIENLSAVLEVIILELLFYENLQYSVFRQGNWQRFSPFVSGCFLHISLRNR